MSEIMNRVRELAADADEQALGQLSINPIVVEAGALGQVVPYLRERGIRRAIVAADAITYAIAGESLIGASEGSELTLQAELIKPNQQGDVVADEASVVQLLLAIQAVRAEAVVAAGAGTLHDISRYAAYTAGIPFISVPTAPSVDGFNSKGAPLIIRGEKITIAAVGPDAIFADLDILSNAPSALVAAGFGDMLGKYTSLLDWRFGAAEGGEPYLPSVENITRAALQKCVDQIDAIASRKPEGIRALIEALIESGLAMLLFGQSHSASGSEHHLSHYWEMEYIRLGRRQLLHGAKVGVACAQIAELYRGLAESGADGLAFVKQPERLREDIAALPEADQLRAWLRQVGGPALPQELGIDGELLARSLEEAPQVRPGRYTLLRAYREHLASK